MSTGTGDLGRRSGPDDVQQQLAPYLLPDEQLLWWGRPAPGKHFTSRDLFLVPFSLLWGGFMIFWEVQALTAGPPRGGGPRWVFPLFGVPFILMGLYMIAGRFVVKARRKRQTGYGLTDRRALVAVGASALSEAPVQHQPIDVRRSRDGRYVDVAFGRSASGWGAGQSYANTGLDVFGRGEHPVGFYDVPASAGLEAALQQVRR